MRLLLLILWAALAFAGQSLIPGGSNGTASTPGRATSDSWRHEVGIHNISNAAANTLLFQDSGIDLRVKWTASGTQMEISPYNGNDFASTPCIIDYASYPNGFFLRVNRTYSGSTYTQSYETWSMTGGGRVLCQNTSTTGSAPASGTLTIGANAPARILFMRRSTTTMPLNGRPPLPGDAVGDVYDYKFDGNLLDGSGNSRTITMSGATFAASPSPVVVAAIKVNNPASELGSWIPCAAGSACTASATDSYQTGDNAAPVSYFWQQTSGPTTIRWSSRSASAPAMTGLIAGSYGIRLVVGGDSGTSSTIDLTFGAVAMDSNGVVIHRDATEEALFGPMIAWGRNPVVYADIKTKEAASLAITNWTPYATSPMRAWKAGTVAWQYGRSAALTNSPGTTGTALQFANLNAFDVTAFPFVVYTGSGYASGEVIPICSASSTTLNVCAGGRGSWGRGVANLSSGNTITQSVVKGTGTAFLTDLCPNGIGAAGPSVYSYANVTATNNSTTLTLQSGTWGQFAAFDEYGVTVIGAGLDAVTGRWFGRLVALNGASATLDRAYPGTTGTVTVHVIPMVLNRSPLLERDTTEIPKGTGATPLDADLFAPWGGFCGSNTVAGFWDGILDRWGTPNITGGKYSVNDVDLRSGLLTPAYYEAIMGLYAHHRRTGDATALAAAQAYGDLVLHGDNAGLCCGQMIVGSVMVNARLTGNNSNAVWKKVRRDVLTPMTFSSATCSSGRIDLRSGLSYPVLWMGLAALLDPDGTARSTWTGRLSSLYDALVGCAGAGYDFRQFNEADSAIDNATVTNGSATVTFAGANWPSANCGYVGAGVAQVGGDRRTVTKVSGDNFDGPSQRLVIFRGVQADGSPWFSRYTGTGTSITLPVDYPFATGANVNYWIYNGAAGIGLAYTPVSIRNASLSDARNNPPGAYFCRTDSTSQITLDRAWAYSTITGTGRVGVYKTSGNSTQPVMTGILTTGMVAAEAAARLDGQTTVADNIRTMLKNTVDWQLKADGTGGLNVADRGVYYLRGGACEAYPPSPGSDGGPDNICNDSLLNNRINSTELGVGMSARYLWNQGTTVYRDAGDNLYRAIWNRVGDPTVWGIASDANEPMSILPFSGGRTFVGNLLWDRAAWPAARLGGVAAAQTRTLLRTFTLPAGAADAQFIITAPSGAQATTTCTVSPCSVTMDARQGQHILQIRYRTGGGASLYLTPAVDAEIITVN